MLTPDTDEKCTRDFTREELTELRQLVRGRIREAESRLESLERGGAPWASQDIREEMTKGARQELEDLLKLRRAVR